MEVLRSESHWIILFLSLSEFSPSIIQGCPSLLTRLQVLSGPTQGSDCVLCTVGHYKGFRNDKSAVASIQGSSASSKWRENGSGLQRTHVWSPNTSLPKTSRLWILRLKWLWHRKGQDVVLPDIFQRSQNDCQRLFTLSLALAVPVIRKSGLAHSCTGGIWSRKSPIIPSRIPCHRRRIEA